MYKIDSIDISGFTVFRDQKLTFSPGVNVFVGTNGTGKTHLLKLLYAAQKRIATGNGNTSSSSGSLIGGAPSSSSSGSSMSNSSGFANVGHGNIIDLLLAVFRPESLMDLIARDGHSQSATVQVESGRSVWRIEIPLTNENVLHRSGGDLPELDVHGEPIFIPTKDMLGNALGFSSLYDQREIDFDSTYRDILTLAYTPPLRATGQKDLQDILSIIERNMDGKAEVKSERIYLVGKQPGRRFEMHLVAEGWRKLVLLYLLVANGSLSKNSILFWDEPENNLNPSLIKDVVEVLVSLSRMGAQVFLSTHSYVVLKELELQTHHNDHLLLFALDRRPDGTVTHRTAQTYAQIEPNAIADEYEHLLHLEVKQALGV